MFQYCGGSEDPILASPPFCAVCISFSPEESRCGWEQARIIKTFTCIRPSLATYRLWTGLTLPTLGSRLRVRLLQRHADARFSQDLNIIATVRGHTTCLSKPQLSPSKPLFGPCTRERRHMKHATACACARLQIYLSSLSKS